MPDFVKCCKAKYDDKMIPENIFCMCANRLNDEFEFNRTFLI